TFVKRARHLTIVGALVAIVIGGVLILAHSTRTTAQPSPPPPPEVTVVKVTGENVPVYREYPARTYARDQVEVRGRVDGYIERRTFDIGSDVRAGQVLYVLDLRPYQTEVERARGALAQATADLAQAEANLVKAQQDVDRFTQLVKTDSVTRQEFDNAN